MFLPGLNAKKSIAVTFHCILPKLLWEWNEMSCMHMRFEGHNLGNWEDNVGDFIPKRFVTLDLVAGQYVHVYMQALSILLGSLSCSVHQQYRIKKCASRKSPIVPKRSPCW